MDGSTQHASTAHSAADAALTLGDYVLSARIARRASADVYEATHAPTGAPRLVYVLRPGAMQDHPLVHRVVCEVDAARWLRHPAIAKVDGYGDTPSRRLYLGVERAPGRTLRALLADGERIAAWRVARLASRLVEALDEAHAVGLTHGHLTPDAVVLAPETEAAGSPPLVTLVGLGAARRPAPARGRPARPRRPRRRRGPPAAPPRTPSRSPGGGADRRRGRRPAPRRWGGGRRRTGPPRAGPPRAGRRRPPPPRARGPPAGGAAATRARRRRCARRRRRPRAARG